jgi:hypothetical protein
MTYNDISRCANCGKQPKFLIKGADRNFCFDNLECIKAMGIYTGYLAHSCHPHCCQVFQSPEDLLSLSQPGEKSI